jgi:hypothetical protein
MQKLFSILIKNIKITNFFKKRFYSDGIDRSLSGYTNSRGSVAAEVYSAPFKVYSAKKFPGMTGTKRAT